MNYIIVIFYSIDHSYNDDYINSNENKITDIKVKKKQTINYILYHNSTSIFNLFILQQYNFMK